MPVLNVWGVTPKKQNYRCKNGAKIDGQKVFLNFRRANIHVSFESCALAQIANGVNRSRCKSLNPYYTRFDRCTDRARFVCVRHVSLAINRGRRRVGFSELLLRVNNRIFVRRTHDARYVPRVIPAKSFDDDQQQSGGYAP